MKYIVIILFIFSSFLANAQLPTQTVPTQFSTGYFKWGWARADSGIINSVRDTFYARYDGTQIIRVQSGDTASWFNVGRHWFRALQAPDTISLSNRINLKLNITDTTGKWWSVNKRWVDTVYRVNDSTIGFTINNGAQQTFQILGRSSGGGGGGSGTVTSVGLSMPSAFTVGGTNPVTSSGTISVSGAGTSSQYIRGNGTLATTDTSMIPNFYLKTRSLFSGASPITFNSATGVIGALRSNTTGQLGVATFNNSDFTDNGAGLISLRSPGASITADNGLTLTGSNIQLGGALIQPTSITSASGANRIVYSGVSASSDGPQLEVSTSGSIGIAVKGGSTDGRGVFGTATTGVGVYGSATGSGGIGLFSITTDGSSIYSQSTTGKVFEGINMPATTNSIESVGAFTRSSSVTGANGIGGSLDFNLRTSTADQLTNQIIWKLTDATNASRTSAFEFWNVNNATLGRNALLAGNGQWTWDGYPALTAQTDTTTYKPVGIDGSGNVVKMNNWVGSGGGSIPSWQQTLDVSNTHTSVLIYDTAMTDNPATHEWARYEKLYKADTATTPFYQWQYSGTNNGTRNEVMFWGWNIGPGGGNEEAGKPAIGESWESNYQINPLYPISSDRLMEKHEIYVTPSGTQHRLSSYTINTDQGTIDFYHTVGGFSLHAIDTHTPYYSISGFNHNTQYSIINKDDQSDYFAWNAEFIQDVNTSSLTLGSSTSKPVSFFKLQNFNTAYLPDVSFTGLGYGGAALAFGGTTVGALGSIIYDSSQTLIQNNTNVPINFSIDGQGIATFLKTRSVLSTPLAINTNTPGSTPFAGLQSTVNSSTLEAAGWFQQTGTSGDKWAIEAYATGATSGTNEGLYVVASGGGTNHSIRIQGPSAGASNYAIYADAGAQSYFAGKIGIGSGNVSPDSNLSVAGSFHTTAGVRMDNLPNAVGTKSVRYDPSTGIISYADTASGGGGTTLYSGDGSISGDRTVTGNNHSLTFDTLFNFRVNANSFIQSQKDKAFPYTGTVIAVNPHNYQFGYTPTPTVYSKGAGIYIDTNNNVGLANSVPTTVPLYATGNSAYVSRFQSGGSNYFKSATITSSTTATNDNYIYLLDATSGNLTITLPAASDSYGGNVGLYFKFKRMDNSGNTITIQRAGSDTIDAGTSFTLTTQYEVKEICAISTSAWGMF